MEAYCLHCHRALTADISDKLALGELCPSIESVSSRGGSVVERPYYYFKSQDLLLLARDGFFSMGSNDSWPREKCTLACRG